MRLNTLATYSKSSLILLGLLVLFGHVFQLPLLVQIFPGMIGMVPNTALDFILLSVGLSLLSGSTTVPCNIQQIIFVMVFLLAAVSFFEDIFQYNLGVDHWLSTSWLNDSNPSPGRMAPNTSLAFMLSATAGFLLPYGDKKPIAIIIQLFTLLILFIAIISLLIYSMQWEFIFNWYRFTRMAPHTAVGFILSCLALGATWGQTRWYKNFYQGIEDKKIMLVSGIILLFITLVSGLGSIAGLTYININAVQHSLEYTLQNKVNTFAETIELIQQEVDTVKSYLMPYTKDRSSMTLEHINKTMGDLSNKGFNTIQLFNKEGEIIYTKGNFKEIFLMEVPLALHFKASLGWENGFWFKANIPFYLEPNHTLQGYLIIEKFLPKLTEDYQNYENLGATGEAILCYHLKENYAECFPTRFSPKRNIVPIRNNGRVLAISYAFSGLTGSLYTRDYRGDNVLATYSPLKNLGLGMVIKIKTTEIYKPIRQQLQVIIPTGVILIILGLFLLRWQVVPLIRKVITSEQEANESRIQSIENNKELTQRNKEIHLLRELNSSLQSCLNLGEAYSLVRQYGKQLLPDLGVTFYLMHKSQNYLEAILGWGKPIFDEKILNPQDCWALRKGKLHKVKNADIGLVCPHSHPLGVDAPPSVCIPMLTQNDVNGLLYIEWTSSSELAWTHENLEKLDLAVTFSEQIFLSISNIKLRETLRNQSIRDKLTGVYNRRYLEETMDRELHRIKRSSSTMALFMIDIDHFKYFNDNFGHKAGDIVLQALGQLLTNFVREADIPCRFGGEEFILILPDISMEHALLRAEELHSRISQLHLHHNDAALGTITISIGVAMYPNNGSALEDLIHNADMALYEAKNKGRNMTMIYGHDS